jgi:hypothetical protein
LRSAAMPVMAAFMAATATASRDLQRANVPLVSERPRAAALAREGHWAGAGAISGFRCLTTGAPARRQPVVWLARSNPPVAACPVRDGPVWNDDAVEFFVAPESGARYRQVVVNAAGTVYDGPPPIRRLGTRGAGCGVGSRRRRSP